MTLLLAFCLAFLASAAAQEGEKKKDEKAEEKKAAEKTDEGKSAAIDDSKLDLDWKLEKGKPFYQKMTTTTVQNLKVMGMDVDQRNVQEFYFKWEPVEQKDGGWVVKQTIEGVKMEIDIAGNPISYDSTAGGTAENSLSQFFQALVETELTYTFDKDFKVVSVTGGEELIKKLTQANSRMEKLLGRILSEDALKQMAAPTFGMVTRESVEKGKSWTPTTTKLNLGPIGNFENTYEYTYVGPAEGEGDLRQVDVTVTVKYTPPAPGEVREGLPFQITGAKLDPSEEGQNTGTLTYDAAAGRVTMSEVDVTLNGELDLDIGGMETKVNLKQNQTTKVETGDKSLLPNAS